MRSGSASRSCGAGQYEEHIELVRQQRADGPAPRPGATHDHGQEQSAAHQQHRPQGPGRT
ncbi:hypothetical protein OG883_46220 [Streptomyces sp. NBC_01142]|uniref:hypothetical protein n=1 Tax=Streptomyces sp. NBC_01142 TaxID=2975865 RepID=UPI002250A1B9|nr:hypothetical protein [Streptomyces sp. NBC_01142]MCX4827037.1 hypothetical protein [Streptomyces sp. NBC_01142]